MRAKHKTKKILSEKLNSAILRGSARQTRQIKRRNRRHVKEKINP